MQLLIFKEVRRKRTDIQYMGSVVCMYPTPGGALKSDLKVKVKF